MKIRINFQKERLGPYTESRIKKAWKTNQISCATAKPTVIREGNKKVLQLSFSKGTFGKESKASWHINFKKSYEVLYCQYKVKFGEGFDWRLGGKLPGFGGGDKPGGGKHSLDGFSSRVMWRDKGTMHQYSYYPEDNTNYGRGFWWHNLCSKKMEQLRFIPDKWHTIKMKINMNKDWREPGYIICWLDGKLALFQDVKWKLKDKQYGIESFMFTVFFGGNDKSFAPRRDCKIYFDDFIISDEDIK